MSKREICLSFGGVVLALAAAGCIMPFNGPAGARRDVQRATGREYSRTFAVTVGRSGLALIRRVAGEEGEEDLPLEGLRKVEVGFYEVRGGRSGSPAGAGITAGSWTGWTPLVEMHPEESESVLILSEGDPGESIRRMLLLVESDDELVIVRLKGELDRLVEEAIRYAFQQAERPDLVTPSLEEYRRGRGDPSGT